MPEILFATSNVLKVQIAQHAARQCGFAVRQVAADVPEIQSENTEAIIRDKAEKVFARVQKPVVVSDDVWLIAGLRGFPGPYMKSMAKWLQIEDWLRLIGPLTDRRVTLRQQLVYQDAGQQKYFKTDVVGTLLPAPRSQSDSPLMAFVSFDNGQTSVAERHDQSQSAILKGQTAWHLLCAWLKEQA